MAITSLPLSKFWQLILILFGLNFNVSAQIIKVDKDWIENDSISLWQSIMDVSVGNVKNTISIFQLAGSIQISHSINKNLVLSSSNLRLLYEENEALENAGFQHIRYIRTLDATLSIEGFTQIQFDQLLKIRMRWISGAGLRFTLLNMDLAKIYLRPGYMYEYEIEDSTKIVNRNHRMSHYLTFHLKGGDKARFYFTNHGLMTLQIIGSALPGQLNSMYSKT